MTLVTPHPWVAGTDYGTATNLNTLTDAISQLQGGAPSSGALDFAVLRQTATQTLTTGVSATLTFTTEDIDAAGGHSTTTNTGRYTAVNAGWYQINVSVSFAGAGVGGSSLRSLRLTVNGTTSYGLADVYAQGATTVSGSTKLYLAASDYVVAEARQDSGADLSTRNTDRSTRMDIEWRHS